MTQTSFLVCYVTIIKFMLHNCNANTLYNINVTPPYHKWYITCYFQVLSSLHVKNNIVTLHVDSILYRRNETCLLGVTGSKILAILQDFNGIFLKYSLNIMVLCGKWSNHVQFVLTWVSYFFECALFESVTSIETVEAEIQYGGFEKIDAKNSVC